VSTPPADTSILQDFYITLMTDVADVSFGQYKIPVSYEGMNSSSKTLFPERAPVSRAFGDRRDIGVKVEKQFEYVGYVLGLFNGQGLNQVDTNNQKDLALRIEGYPMKGIMIGAVGYVALGQRAQPGTKDRVEGDLKIEFENALLQAEYIHGWDGPRGTRVEGHGAYGALGYTFAEKYQPLVRVGFLDPNVDGTDTTLTHYELGFNYYLLKQELKFSAAYGLTESAAVGVSRRHEGILAAQLSF
jgi:phosphate-selective porin